MKLLQTLPELKCVIFDMDGVLFLSGAAHDAAFRTVLREVGVTHFDYRWVAGMRTMEAMRWLLQKEKRKFTSVQLAAWARRKQSLAYRLLEKHPPIAKGCKPLLVKLSKYYQVALVSSSRRKNVNLFLRASGTRRLFSLIMSGDDLAQSKPSPLVYKSALKRLHLKSKEVLVVEDSQKGIRAGVGAGLRVLGIQKNGSRAFLLKAGAFRVIRDIRELKAA